MTMPLYVFSCKCTSFRVARRVEPSFRDELFGILTPHDVGAIDAVNGDGDHGTFRDADGGRDLSRGGGYWVAEGQDVVFSSLSSHEHGVIYRRWVDIPIWMSQTRQDVNAEFRGRRRQGMVTSLRVARMWDPFPKIEKAPRVIWFGFQDALKAR